MYCHSRKCISKCYLRNVRHFVSASMLKVPILLKTQVTTKLFWINPGCKCTTGESAWRCHCMKTLWFVLSSLFEQAVEHILELPDIPLANVTLLPCHLLKLPYKSRLMREGSKRGFYWIKFAKEITPNNSSSWRLRRRWLLQLRKLDSMENNWEYNLNIYSHRAYVR